MLIKTLTIENFRGIRNVTAEFEGEGVYLVLGPNGSGKSSFIEAVRWIAEGFASASWHADLQRMGGFSLCVTRGQEQDAIRCAIGLDSRVDQIMPLGASLPQSLPRLDFRPTIVISASETQFECVLRAMSIGDTSAEAVLTTYLNQDQAKPWLPNTSLRPFTRFAESLRQFNESGAHTGVEIPAPNGYDLLSFVATLQTGDPAAWERVISAVRSIVPETEVEQVLTPLRPREQNADLFVVERSVGRVPWRLAPTGAKQAVFLAALMVACPDESVIFIEEPECNLHPLAQRRLMSFAIQEAKQHHKQIVFTSHSLEIVDSPGWKRAFVLARSGNQLVGHAANDWC